MHPTSSKPDTFPPSCESTVCSPVGIPKGPQQAPTALHLKPILEMIHAHGIGVFLDLASCCSGSRLGVPCFPNVPHIIDAIGYRIVSRTLIPNLGGTRPSSLGLSYRTQVQHSSLVESPVESVCDIGTLPDIPSRYGPYREPQIGSHPRAP